MAEVLVLKLKKCGLRKSSELSVLVYCSLSEVKRGGLGGWMGWVGCAILCLMLVSVLSHDAFREGSPSRRLPVEAFG
jgi:hypothetical protein